MSVSRKSILLLTLIFVSIFASWQGVSASSAAQESCRSVGGVFEQCAVVPLQKNIPMETARTESSALPSGSLIRLPDSNTPTIQYSQSAADSQSQWALKRIHALPSTWRMDSDSPVLVAVLDTGIDKNHEDLSGRVVAEIDLSESPAAADVYGHGTPIAGIIAADVDNGLGIMGLAPESILINVKVADDDGKCRLSALAAGIIWAVDYGARVINISIELKESTPDLEKAIDYAWNQGALVIAAAGNDGSSLPIYPAACENCLAVTAIQENGTLAPLANYGDWVDVAAPGMDIYSTLPGNRYGYKHGTSFATAYVSGLAAVLFSLAADTNGDGKLNDEVRRAIEAGCDAIGIAGMGKGTINVAASVAALVSDNGSLPLMS
jgi:subtilisin family serine protease